MIITLTKADFSSCKIGTLTTFNVRKSTTIGATVNIIKTSVERAGYSSATTIATIVLDEANYEGHAIKVMMGSTDVSSWYSVGNVIVPANTPITSNITISVSATAVSSGDPIIPDVPVTPTMYTFTINPTPTSATVTLTASGYTQSGNSITVPSNTSVAWKVSASGYTEQSGTHTVTKTESKSVALSAVSGGGSGDNVHSNVSYITRVTNNVNIVDSKSVGTTGGYTEDKNYLSYEYTIPYNGTIYFDPSTTSTYVALWHSGTNTRYRKSENNLPSQENSLTVAAGDRIIATLTKGTASSFKLVYNNEHGSTYTEQLIVSKSDMTIHENQTAGANGLTASESYNSWELDFDGKEFEKGYLYMSDFTTAYTAILILSANGKVRYRVTSGEDTLPKDIQTIVPVTSNDTIYVSENKTNSKEFKIHFLTED
jgi:hypothetical protein